MPRQLNKTVWSECEVWWVCRIEDRVEALRLCITQRLWDGAVQVTYLRICLDFTRSSFKEQYLSGTPRPGISTFGVYFL